jgi:hypothetical protein
METKTDWSNCKHLCEEARKRNILISDGLPRTYEFWELTACLHYKISTFRQRLFGSIQFLFQDFSSPFSIPGYLKKHYNVDSDKLSKYIESSVHHKQNRIEIFSDSERLQFCSDMRVDPDWVLYDSKPSVPDWLLPFEAYYITNQRIILEAKCQLGSLDAEREQVYPILMERMKIDSDYGWGGLVYLDISWGVFEFIRKQYRPNKFSIQDYLMMDIIATRASLLKGNMAIAANIKDGKELSDLNIETITTLGIMLTKVLNSEAGEW